MFTMKHDDGIYKTKDLYKYFINNKKSFKYISVTTYNISIEN